MYPAYLIRAGIDWVRHADEFKDSNPYSRCVESINAVKKLFEQQYGKDERVALEPATIAQYWSEFFYAEDPSPDESEWREGLIKRSGQYDSFSDWQDWFKTNYAKVYKEDDIWQGVLMTSWAHTHQFEIVFADDAWEFRPSTSYMPTGEMWRFESHMDTASDVLSELWNDEVKAYAAAGFHIDEQNVPFLGRVECLGFDTKQYTLHWPPSVDKERVVIDVGEMVADIVLPQGDDWYRHLDNVIFADDHLDITSLVSRTKYVFGSRRRLLELSVEKDAEGAKVQAMAEGWMVPTEQVGLSD
ncbi:MAG: hypothetical protein K2Y22_15685 [Candidatus Obscuribacterales bacterium]|nr:hypothetical protein [Candidatus Obscuribacterales bacterium]